MQPGRSRGKGKTQQPKRDDRKERELEKHTVYTTYRLQQSEADRMEQTKMLAASVEQTDKLTAELNISDTYAAIEAEPPSFDTENKKEKMLKPRSAHRRSCQGC